MKFGTALLSASAALLGLAAADDLHYSGFTTFTPIIENQDNSYAISARTLDRSTTLYVSVQILQSGGNHSKAFNDFKTLCANYGPKNVTLIPRLNYIFDNGSIAAEPSSVAQIQNDLNLWIGVITPIINNGGPCKLPLVQAGILGQYGEWHDGPYCSVPGNGSSTQSKALKQQIVKAILGAGTMTAVRTPMDHALVAQSLTSSQLDSFTIHDDCIMAEGPTGSDEGTFINLDGKTAAQWRQYTQSHASGNAFGGEGCPDTYNWSDTATVCGNGPNALTTYIQNMEISYLNPAWPPAMNALFQNTSSTARACISKIGAALQANT